MAQTFNEMMDSEMAQAFKDKVVTTFDPIKDKVANTLDPKVSEMFTSCFVGTMDGEEEYGNENSMTTKGKKAFAKMQGTVGRKFKCDGEDDADTIYTDAFGDESTYDESTYHEEYTTTDLNTIDENNSVRQKAPQNSNVLGENRNVSNGRTYGRSFKDRYVEMKIKQQFSDAPSPKTRKPELSIDATGAAKHYEARKEEKQQREEYAQKLAQKRFGTTTEVPVPVRTPLDP